MSQFEQDNHRVETNQDTRVYLDWEVIGEGGEIVPWDQQPLIKGSQYPLAQSEVIEGEYREVDDGVEDPSKRGFIIGGLLFLAATAASAASGLLSSKPSTPSQSSSVKPELLPLSLNEKLAAVRQTLDDMSKQGITIPTPEASDLLAKITQLAENPSEVASGLADLLNPPSVSPVNPNTGPAVTAVERSAPEVKPSREFLDRVQVVAAELPPVVVPIRNSAPALRAVSWNEAPLTLKQQVPNPEAVAAPSLLKLQSAFTALINGLAQGDDRAIKAQTAWLRQYAPLSVQPLVESLTRSADRLITLQNAGNLYPTPFVYQLIKTIHQLDPTTPEGQTLLNRALQFQQAHLEKLAQDAQEITNAAEALKTHPQIIELPQAVMSPDGIHIAPPPDVVNNLVNQPAQEGGGLILGPIPGFRLVICPSDPLSKLVDSVRTLTGLQSLGPARYKVQRIEKLSNLVPDSLFGRKLTLLKAFADKLTYAELSQTRGVFNYEGFSPPIFMLNAAGLQPGDEIGFTGIVDIFRKAIGQ